MTSTTEKDTYGKYAARLTNNSESGKIDISDDKYFAAALLDIFGDRHFSASLEWAKGYYRVSITKTIPK